LARDSVGKLADEVEGDAAPFSGDPATDDGLSAIATALRIIAAVAALAGAVVLALALARGTRLSLVDHRTLVALGWTRRQLALAAVLVVAPWVLLGVGIGAVGGVLAAPRVMVGLARSVDPEPGSIVIDRGVVLGVALVAVAMGLLVCISTARRLAATDADRVRRPTRLLQLGHPLPVVIGTRHALAGEAHHGGRSSRAAMIVMAAGVAGAVAALMVSASISRLQTDPALIGQGRGRLIDSGESVDVYDRALPQLEHDRRVAMLAGVHLVFGISVGGTREFTALAYDLKRGDLDVSVVEGRFARRSNEVALGPATLDQIGKRVGDHIELVGDSGTARFRIVGTVLFPEGDFDHASGIALTATGADRLVGDAHRAGAVHQVVFDWANGTDTRAADRQLNASGLQVLTNDDALKPASVTNLGQVTTLPRYLAVFLGVMSLATLAHALSVSVRRRSREIATMRALGMTSRASSAVVVSHAVILVGIAIVVGVPLGLALGTRIWEPIAASAYVVVRSVTPASWIALHLLALVVATGLLTAIPAWRALRLRTADILRDE
jgi:putative ABC transport system permease protein